MITQRPDSRALRGAWRLGALLAVALAVPMIACKSDPASDDENGGSGGGGDQGGSGGSSKGGSGGSSSKGGSGGSSKGGSGGDPGPGAQKPDSDSNDDVLKFLKDGEYSKGGWVADVAAPRSQKPPSPHGKVRVFFNEKLVASQAAGRGAKGAAEPYDTDSIVVKALYDASQKNIGWVMLWKATEGADEPENWRLFCVGPSTACLQPEDSTEDAPLTGTLKDQAECYGCHHKDANVKNGLLYTAAPK